jgi:cytochrome d ubiquinol oxidase subunit I
MFLRWGPRLPDGVRLKLLITYSVASFFSLFWVNGILAWQLTPGTWLRSGDVWAGFFNPSFWPSLLYRVAVSSTLAGLAAIAVINTMPIERAARHALIARAARFLVPMAAMPVLGLWYVAVIPDDSREWLMGGSVAMSMFLGLAAGASLLIAAYALLGVLWRKLYVGGATAALLLALAFGATAAGEFVREGARKPYTIRQVLFSNAITPGEVARMRREGSVVGDPYPLRDAARYPTAQLQLGARVVRVQCAACHTMRGANALVHLGGNWTLDQLRLNIAKLQRTKAFMPPFAGPPAEVEAVAQLIKWEAAGAPPAWTVSDDPAVLAQIGAWLDEAGPAAYPETRP